jgi:Phage integrase family
VEPALSPDRTSSSAAGAGVTVIASDAPDLDAEVAAWCQRGHWPLSHFDGPTVCPADPRESEPSPSPDQLQHAPPEEMPKLTSVRDSLQSRRARAPSAGAFRPIHASAGVPVAQCDPHTLRHTFGRLYMSARGTELSRMQRIMGHASPETTSRYVHYDNEELSVEHRRIERAWCDPLTRRQRHRQERAEGRGTSG